jgi:HD-GYP domain-containing protein (c-di-GMP phosphodiesterase class II)
LAILNEKALLEQFLDNPELRGQRVFFNPFLGNAIWWVLSKPLERFASKLSSHPKSNAVWGDLRFEKLSCRQQLTSQISSKQKERGSFILKCRKHRLLSYVIPLIVHDKTIGFLCLSHLRSAVVKQSTLDLLNSTIRSLLGHSVRDYEFIRLSESVRPRAIALSTVHTVHRIINATLDLEELTKRLAHLTAQTVRAKTCSIYLYDASQSPRSLIERASTEKPSKSAKRAHALKTGEGIPGRVFKTSEAILNKGALCVPMIDEDVIGVLSLVGKQEGVFSADDLEILTILAEEAVIAIKNARAYEDQKRVTLEAIQALATILGTRFAKTRKLPSDTLLKITTAVSETLKLSDEERQAIHYATLLKDAGKIGLPDEIIDKPTKLTGEEYQLVRQHSAKGAMIVEKLGNLKPVAPIILYSHEHFDGTGYPNGLKGQDIPIGARLLAVANAFEALIAGRPYRTKSTVKEAIEELKRHEGSQFDPKIVDAFIRNVTKPSIAKLLSQSSSN